MEIRSYQGTRFSLVPLNEAGEENPEFPALFVFGDLLDPKDLAKLAAAIEKAELIGVDLDFSID